MPERQLLTPEEVEPIFGRKRNRLYHDLDAGSIPADLIVRIGRRIYFKKAELYRWLGVEQPERRSSR